MAAVVATGARPMDAMADERKESGEPSPLTQMAAAAGPLPMASGSIVLTYAALGVMIAAAAKAPPPKIILKDGSEYEGDLREGVPDGNGVLRYLQGHQRKRYEGEFRAGLPDGRGKITWHNGDKYEGDVVKGELQGEGIYSNSRGKFEGVVRTNGSWKGTIMFTTGVVYKGECDKQLTPNGLGEIISDEYRWEGNFVNGMKEGVFTSTSPLGKKFTEKYIHDVRVEECCLDCSQNCWAEECVVS